MAYWNYCWPEMLRWNLSHKMKFITKKKFHIQNILFSMLVVKVIVSLNNDFKIFIVNI